MDKDLWEELTAVVHDLRIFPSTRQAIQGASACAGLATDRRSGAPRITKWTMDSSYAIRRINATLPRLPGWPATFEFSALQIGHDTDVSEHLDINNLGDSIVVEIGDYTGGDLWVNGEA